MLIDSVGKSLCSIRPLKFIRKMRGGSQSSLLEAEDGNYYIVKLPDNPQGPEVLFNEAFGTLMMRFLGLPVPEWRVIALSDEFIDHNCEMWIETAGSIRQRPNAGLCFGSRLVLGGEDETLYELLPRQLFDLIENKDDFIGMLLFDVWAKQSDFRQALFLQNAKTRLIKVTFIDQGDLFERRKLPRRNAHIGGSYLDPLVYRNIDLVNSIPKWEARIRTITPYALDVLGYTSPIPQEWYSPCMLADLWTELTERQHFISSYITAIKSFLEDVNNARDRSENPRIPHIEIRAFAPQQRGFGLPRTRC